MNRHRSSISIRKPKATSCGRALGFNKESVKKDFDSLSAEYEKHQYPPYKIFKVDETGLSIVQNKHPQVVGMGGKKHIGAFTAAERRKLVTIVACMGAGGDYVPPMLTFSRKNWSLRLMKEAPPGSLGRCHPSGWIQSYLFT